MGDGVKPSELLALHAEAVEEAGGALVVALLRDTFERAGKAGWSARTTATVVEAATRWREAREALGFVVEDAQLDELMPVLRAAREGGHGPRLDVLSAVLDADASACARKVGDGPAVNLRRAAFGLRLVLADTARRPSRAG